MTDMGAVKEMLEQRLSSLKHEITEIDHTLREPDSADSEERATENEGDEVLEGLGNAHLAESHQIEAALKRIELETYGQCTHCGDPVGEKRLEAIPWVAHCIDCAKELGE